MFSTFRGLQAAAAGQGSVSPWENWNGSADGADYLPMTGIGFQVVSVQSLSNTQFLLIGTSGTNTYAWIGTINNRSISYGNRSTIIAAIANLNLSICQLSPGIFIMTYIGFGTTHVIAQIVTASGINIAYSAGTVIAGNSQENSDMEIVALTSSTALLYYQDNSNNWQLVAMSLSGSTILPGLPYQLTTSAYSIHALSAISATQAVASGFDAAMTQIISVVINVSGTTIDPPGLITTIQTFSGLGNASIVQTSIGSNGIIVLFSAESTTPPNNWEQDAVYLTISGNTITHYIAVQTVAPQSGLIQNCWIESLNNVDSMAVYSIGGAAVYGKVIGLSGTLLLPKTAVLLGNLSQAPGDVIAQMDPITSVFAFIDNSGNPFSRVLKAL